MGAGASLANEAEMRRFRLEPRGERWEASREVHGELHDLEGTVDIELLESTPTKAESPGARVIHA